ncbi:endonuclease domain-containing protein [Larkinella sp. GY13]|uniref:endonuclease domain-containing protein n=1 Tax=Larkinella sp. GY13 TaxID=3453720 RepID=UPI003EEA7491
MTTQPANDTLVALLKDKTDFTIAQEQGWYRIPVSTRVPDMVRKGTIKYIAFYFKKIFGDWKYSIRQYTPVTTITEVTRRELMPHQSYHPKAGNKYYKISFGPLQDLPRPIVSHRGRQLLFIPTTLHKLLEADEINDIFADSPLENRLWAELKKNNLPAERQFFLQTNEANWICDFAFFCKTGTINVECDGDAYHMKPEQVIYDKTRNNEITAVANWAVLRFTTKHLMEDMPYTIQTIKRKIDKFGGLHYAREDAFKYVSKKDGQLGLFD